jgi:hypothetical protein
MDNHMVECKVRIPRTLLNNLPKMTSANPQVRTAAEHLKEAVRMYVLLHAAHDDGKSLYVGADPSNLEKLRLFA